MSILWLANSPKGGRRGKRVARRRKLFGAALKAHLKKVHRRNPRKRRKRSRTGSMQSVTKHGHKVSRAAWRASGYRRNRRRKRSRRKLHGAALLAHLRRIGGGSVAKRRRRRNPSRRRRHSVRRYRRNPPFAAAGKNLLGLLKTAAPAAGAVLAGEAVSEFIAQKIPFGDGSDIVHGAKKLGAGVLVAQFVIPAKFKLPFAAGVLASVARGLLKNRVAALAPYLGDNVVYVPLRSGSLSPSLTPGYGAYQGSYQGAYDSGAMSRLAIQ